MKAIKYILGAIIALAIIMVISYQIFFRLPLPDYKGTVEISGLISDVEVRFDKYGVPHISANNNFDLFFAQGYITARDRMFQMDMTRRAGRGELSVIFGEATIEADRFLKTAGFYRTAIAEYAAMSDKYKDIIEAYTRGVNAYIDSVERLPREYVILGVKPEHWIPEDTIVCGILMAYNLTRSKKTDLILYRVAEAAGDEILELITPSFPDFAPTVSKVDRDIVATKKGESHLTLFEANDTAIEEEITIPGLCEVRASNWMIFSGKKTETGDPIFTGSLDLEPKLPALFYLVHLKGGEYDVIGGSIPGAPGVNALGFNGRIAWSCVNGRVDELDYFIEKINPDNPNQYLTESGWKDFEITHETIKIKTDDGFAEEKLAVKISRHGPIISYVMSLAPENTAMMWVGSEPTGVFEGFDAINKARNFYEFRRAISLIKTPTLNMGYADTEGNIGYQYMASPPIRKKGNGTIPVAGWEGEYDWGGHVPFKELPYDLNPEKGYLASFNNEPKKTTYHITNYYLFERALRFDEIKDKIETLTPDEARKIQLDTVSPIAERWTSQIIRVCGDIEELKDSLELLDGWDYSIDRESPAASLFEAFYFCMLGNTFADEVGGDLWGDQLSEDYIIYVPDLLLTKIADDNDHFLFDDVTTTDTVETKDDIIKKSMIEAKDELTCRLGDDPKDWKWERIHRMTFKHPMGSKLFFFNLSPIPTHGDGFTINAGSLDNKNLYEMKSGGVIRMIVDFSKIENSTFISPPGQSGLYMNPHYDDMAQMWADGYQIPMHYLTFDKLTDVFVLKPKK